MARAAEKMEEDLVGIPKDYLCPITTDIMSDPMVAADGHSYERYAIKEWISRGHINSPMTNQQLAYRNLTPNHRLRSVIEEFKARLPQVQREQQIQADLDMAIKLKEERRKFTANGLKVTKSRAAIIAAARRRNKGKKSIRKAG